MDFFNFFEEESVRAEILKGASKGFVSRDVHSAHEVSPRIIYNNKRQSRTMLSTITEELKHCSSFCFTVAFITMQGLKSIEPELKAVLAKGGKNKILTSIMNYFNNPDVFHKLLSYENLEVRIYGRLDEAQPAALHAKGYYFSYPKHANLIVGSANLTGSGLQQNKEWNVRLSSLQSGHIIQEMEEDFAALWEESEKLTADWIQRYEKRYAQEKGQQAREKVTSIHQGYFVPNAMQQEALQSIQEQWKEGVNRSLLISATGTGKTILSAFSVKEFEKAHNKPIRVLFLAHREQLLAQAKRSYQQVLRKAPHQFGLLTGTEKTFDKEYLFASVQTLQKDALLSRFDASHFDYIIVDEAHHIGAITYKKILDYFKPQFLLGMTATPDRNDEFDIYDFFNYNIAYEISLQQAQAYNLLCPFHYYGVTDIFVDEERRSDEEFNRIELDRRVDYILQKAEEYGDAGQAWHRTRGLVFCATRQEAKEIAEAFTARGRKSEALTSEDSPKRRRQVIGDLESGKIEYICTVDIFNEGVDIPSVNLVLMLRPTDSSIVFIQQLGRGLRKHQSKEYVVILDFIGNNKKNYLIACALSGDMTGNRERLRKFIGVDHRFLEGQCTIHMEEIAKSRIYSALNHANFSQLKALREAYQALRRKLGDIPKVADFAKYGTLDIMNFIYAKKNYHQYLCSEDKSYKSKMSAKADDLLSFFCSKLAKGKRRYEIEVLQDLMREGQATYTWKPLLAQSVVQVLTGKFYNTTLSFVEVELLQTIPGITSADTMQAVRFRPSQMLQEALAEETFREHFSQMLDYAQKQYEERFSNTYEDTDFVWQELYSLEEIERLLCWEKSENGGMVGGYRYNAHSDTLPVFIHYDDIQSDTQEKKYDDHFLSPDRLLAYSKNKRNKQSKDILQITKGAINTANKDAAKYTNTKVYLFVTKQGKRLKEDGTNLKHDFKEMGGKAYYFLGEIFANPEDIVETVNHLDPKQQAICKLTYRLKTPVSQDLYEYLTRELVSV